MQAKILLRYILILPLLAWLAACGRDASLQDGESDAQKNVTDTAMAQAEAPRPENLPAPAEVAAVPDDAEVTASGLASKILIAGAGRVHPGPSSKVEVHYTGWTTDGQMFDSSRVRGQTAVFPLNRVIAGWTEGLQLMVVGEQRRFWIPAELAYANSTRPGAPQGMLVFDVELIDIKD